MRKPEVTATFGKLPPGQGNFDYVLLSEASRVWRTFHRHWKEPRVALSELAKLI